MDLFGGVETEIKKGKRAATWQGLRISLYSVALNNMHLLPLVICSAFVPPAGLPVAHVGLVVALDLYCRYNR
jgi:hypothetical protein